MGEGTQDSGQGWKEARLLQVPKAAPRAADVPHPDWCTGWTGGVGGGGGSLAERKIGVWIRSFAGLSQERRSPGSQAGSVVPGHKERQGAAGQDSGMAGRASSLKGLFLGRPRS